MKSKEDAVFVTKCLYSHHAMKEALEMALISLEDIDRVSVFERCSYKTQTITKIKNALELAA